VTRDAKRWNLQLERVMVVCWKLRIGTSLTAKAIGNDGPIGGQKLTMHCMRSLMVCVLFHGSSSKATDKAIRIKHAISSDY
jgi:hypothetical protein